MKKRTFERVNACLELKFSYNNSVYSGSVTNLSENGMCINTSDCPPIKSNFEVRFPLEGEVLTLPAKVRRLLKRHDSVYAMGVELFNPSMKYLRFVNYYKWESSVTLPVKTSREASLYTCNLCGHITFEQIPTECPICWASIEYIENSPDSINRPRDPHNLTEFEKTHIPIINISKTDDFSSDNGYDVNVKIGEIYHSMNPEDHIAFIDYYLQSSDIKKRCLGRMVLRCDRIRPSVMFKLSNVTSARLTVVSNCTAHGSWMSQTEL